jgi:hypothetical protein
VNAWYRLSTSKNVPTGIKNCNTWWISQVARMLEPKLVFGSTRFQLTSCWCEGDCTHVWRFLHGRYMDPDGIKNKNNLQFFIPLLISSINCETLVIDIRLVFFLKRNKQNTIPVQHWVWSIMLLWRDGWSFTISCGWGRVGRTRARGTLNMIFSVWLYLVLLPPYLAQHWFSILW